MGFRVMGKINEGLSVDSDLLADPDNGLGDDEDNHDEEGRRVQAVQLDPVQLPRPRLQVLRALQMKTVMNVG